MKPLFIAATEVSKLFPGLSPKTLANLRSQGRGPRFFKKGRRVFYRVEDLERWLAEGEVKTSGC
ncbi:helix-turn-helix domain-containing protein [Thermosulfuriphilus ammonigenes]|uniref:Helix-turn-helix domain-containing protein n=1 Tax=Thermosulfuriphilus ammonigenes TaxID=1936021 RepID=A0A6G7PU95_9BACT|nr:helix-turn-helix domain-containing protein [Thermosulfuriphilus ammonigenes]MBA2848672.1 hypothetical protein [Thermosulfuriphilus ammonigenes]QIJ71190.1 helix-turn-helix domain-containing protein [Thermosulfuriphilus ammonigenes]